MNEPADNTVQRVLAEAEAIRAGGASTQANAPHEGGGGGTDGQPSAPPPSPDWKQYEHEAALCAMYGDVLLRRFGCDELGPEERQQATQAWAELLAKWFPSIKEFMGPELRLLTIYGLPIAGRMVGQWMSAPSPESSGDVGAEKLRS